MTKALFRCNDVLSIAAAGVVVGHDRENAWTEAQNEADGEPGSSR